MPSSVYIVLVLFLCTALVCGEEEVEDLEELYTERLLIEPLHDKKILVHFEFTMARNQSAHSQMSSFNLFPKGIGQIVAQYATQEFHLSFTQGRWDAGQWGYPPKSAPSGVSLWAWFSPGSPSLLDQRWLGLQRALGGLFSASLNFMDLTTTVSPLLTFGPRGDLYTDRKIDNEESHGVRYAVLPREAVCTENLTPYMRQLPCRQQKGIGMLLGSPTDLYSTHYHSMDIAYTTHCLGEGDECSMQEHRLTQTMTLVFNPLTEATTKVIRDKIMVDLKGLFGISKDITACPLAASTSIHLGKSEERLVDWKSNYDLPAEGAIKLVAQKPFSLSYTLPLSNSVSTVESPLLMNRYMTGHGRKSGSIVTHIINQGNHTVDFSYLQSLPWYLRAYYHTLKASINNKDLPITELLGSNHQLITGRDRNRSSVLEFEYSIDPHSVFTLELQVERLLLHWTEYPPDPNRGFDIGPAVVYLRQSRHISQYRRSLPLERDEGIYLYTTGLMVMMPLPDFSMPYNVITLTCSIVALFFGQLVASLTRRYKSTYAGKRDFISKRPLAQLYRTLLDRRIVNAILGPNDATTENNN